MILQKKCFAYVDAPLTRDMIDTFKSEYDIRLFREFVCPVFDPSLSAAQVCRKYEQLVDNNDYYLDFWGEVENYSNTRSFSIVSCEPILQFRIVNNLIDSGFRCFYPTFRNVVTTDPDTGAERTFRNFVLFREYQSL